MPYIPPVDENEEMIDAPDIYWEISFAQLVKEYKVQKTERQKYNILKNDSGKFTQNQINEYINPYISLVERNEGDILFRINELTDMHIDRINPTQDLITTDERINAVRQLYERATNKDNPNRDQVKIEPALRGRISSKIMSYNLYDNQKYKLIEELLEAIEESFGVKNELDLKLKKMKTFMPEGKIQDLEGNEINMVNDSSSS